MVAPEEGQDLSTERRPYAVASTRSNEPADYVRRIGPAQSPAKLAGQFAVRST